MFCWQKIKTLYVIYRRKSNTFLEGAMYELNVPRKLL